ncbi:MAG TPA: DcrB-related protein, partial [Polyangiaceae bacterium]|nr:DcrB-related protein [Polyangiaceae bacterium]
MSRYDSRDLAFDVPRHWEDKTLVAFSAPARPGQATAPNLVMTRDMLGPSDTLDGYADRQLSELSKRLQEFELVGRRERTLGGQPAEELHFEWLGQLLALMRKRVFLDTAVAVSRGSSCEPCALRLPACGSCRPRWRRHRRDG